MLASVIMLGFGLWWLQREETAAKRRGEGFGDGTPKSAQVLADDEILRERATTAREFDPAEIVPGKAAPAPPSFTLAAAPIVVVILVNLALSLIVPPRLDLGFQSKPEWGGHRCLVRDDSADLHDSYGIGDQRPTHPNLRATIDVGVNASAPPAINVASLVGFGAVVAALPAFRVVREAVLGIGGGPLVSLAVATNHHQAFRNERWRHW
jgi:hypothetical protein